MNPHWLDVAAVAAIPSQGAQRITIGQTPIAIFGALDGAIFALVDRCPHKGGPLSQGIVHGHAVACPLHNWSISLATGQALAPDKGCAHRLDVMVRDGRVFLDVSKLKSPQFEPVGIEV